MRDPSLTVVAIGGHALLDPELPPTVDAQFVTTAAGTAPIAELLARGEDLVITHGNGPQVGFLMLRMEMASSVLHQVPLDSLVADTQGSLGYMIQRALRAHLRELGSERRVCSIITEVVIDPEDPAFKTPTKPVGMFYDAAQAQVRRREDRWDMVEEAGRGFRRVVASPKPVDIVQLDTIRQLVESGVTVIACGGGGIPVTRVEAGELQGKEAVIDKDRTSALLAASLGAERLIIATAVDGVYRDFGTDHAAKLDDVSVEELRALAAAGQFPAGSMGPKVEAAIHFLDHGGGTATICSSEDLVKAFDGDAGTQIRATRT